MLPVPMVAAKAVAKAPNWLGDGEPDGLEYFELREFESDSQIDVSAEKQDDEGPSPEKRGDGGDDVG